MSACAGSLRMKACAGHAFMRKLPAPSMSTCVFFNMTVYIEIYFAGIVSNREQNSSKVKLCFFSLFLKYFRTKGYCYGVSIQLGKTKTHFFKSGVGLKLSMIPFLKTFFYQITYFFSIIYQNTESNLFDW